MKKIILILFMMAAAAAVFASGAYETNDQGVVMLNEDQLERGSFLNSPDKVELDGTIQFECPVPELEAEGESYTLMTPGAMGFYRYISEGDRIKVSGYILDHEKMTEPMGCFKRMYTALKDFDALNGNPVVLVETVEFKGTAYQLPWVNHERDVMEHIPPNMGRFEHQGWKKTCKPEAHRPPHVGGCGHNEFPH